MKVLNVQGRKKTGKTTTVTNIIAELCKRNYSVGSIKGIHIDGFTMDNENEDTGKHKKAGADPVTARCHEETNIMYKGKKNLAEILAHYSSEWVIIESHVDLQCPNIITGRTEDMLDDRVDEFTIGCSGVVAGNEITEHEFPNGTVLPVINSITDIEKLVDLIEEKTDEYVPAAGVDLAENMSVRAADKVSECMTFDKCTDPVEIKIIKPDRDFSLLEKNEYISVDRNGHKSDGSETMLTESTIDIYINEIRTGSLPYTPENIVELVLGWAQSEGYFNDLSQVREAEINDDGSIARISVNPTSKLPYELCTGIGPVKSIEWKREWIFEMAADFENILPLRQETMAAHNCRIAKTGTEGFEILFRCEDIGRHSAIDKAVGWGLLNEIDMRKCMLFTSGRISRAMVRKVVRAGIPIMAGKGTISKKAVQLANECGLTLIGYAKPDKFTIFNDPGQG